MPETLVLAESAGGKIDPITAELVTAARALGKPVAVAVLGDRTDALAAQASALGVERVYTAQDPQLADTPLEAMVEAFAQVCRTVGPETVIVGRTTAGSDIAPRVAFRLGAGVAQDCTAIKTDAATGRVVATRPVYGGNAVALVTFPAGVMQFLIMRSKVYEPAKSDASRKADTVPVKVEIKPGVVKVKHIETVRQASQGVKLEDAAVVVSGGRGLGGPEPFKQLKELADVLGGAMGASRAACDAGWIDHSHQVGLTGVTVAPSVYIAIGISGASQHMAGLSGAKHIVAINRDREANIFKEASYGVVGDWKAILPSFVATLRELVKS
ncbi:MAG: electron transfer flavoprotein subunit alpha/FixB family protein [SAR202 cluster bacterium]|nr:electron transfer flavoprotein subunit alpha/FixB family protein [SAR202 cluster bacterium]